LIISPNRRRRVNLRARPRRFAYIPNAVDARFMEATRQPIAGRVLFCGGEHPIKGFAELRVAWPEVLRRCSTASLEATGFARPAEQSALPAAEVLGPLPTSALLSALERAELLVLPSHFEVSPNLVVEAWAAGTPVIASSVGGIPVLGGDAVQRVRPGDPQALAAAIVAGLRGELDLEGLARRGRRRAVAHLPGAVATRHLAAYTSLLEASVPSRERAEPARCD
jgi:glycosyltransferase involved in cell wall biosynthesis